MLVLVLMVPKLLALLVLMVPKQLALTVLLVPEQLAPHESTAPVLPPVLMVPELCRSVARARC